MLSFGLVTPFCIAFVERGKSNAVKPYEAVKGRKPKISIRCLRDLSHPVLRQPVICVPEVETVLAAHGKREQE